MADPELISVTQMVPRALPETILEPGLNPMNYWVWSTKEDPYINNLYKCSAKFYERICNKPVT